MGMPVGIGGVLLCSGTLGGVALRIVLGDQAFASYFGNHVCNWALSLPWHHSCSCQTRHYSA
jgi:hypothetical protein